MKGTRRRERKNYQNACRRKRALGLKINFVDCHRGAFCKRTKERDNEGEGAISPLAYCLPTASKVEDQSCPRKKPKDPTVRRNRMQKEASSGKRAKGRRY